MSLMMFLLHLSQMEVIREEHSVVYHKRRRTHQAFFAFLSET